MYGHITYVVNSLDSVNEHALSGSQTLEDMDSSVPEMAQTNALGCSDETKESSCKGNSCKDIGESAKEYMRIDCCAGGDTAEFTGITSHEKCSNSCRNEKASVDAHKDACCPYKEKIEDRELDQEPCCFDNDNDIVGDECCDKSCSVQCEEPSQSDCNDCCPSSNDKTKMRDSTPDCCESKPVPCCDSSCIDRIAVRECNTECGEPSTGRRSRAKNTACASHKKRTHEKFAAKLAALECICRALIARGQESCCKPEEQPHKRGCSKRKKSPDSSLHSSCVHKSGSQIHSSTCTKRCRDPHKIVKNEIQPVTKETANETACGDDHVTHVHTGSDTEKGCLGIEHVVLSITGMTCTGCETKVQRTLGSLPSITNLKTSLIMARAEFNLDTASMSPESVVKFVERTTEFKCARISTKGSCIDIVSRNVKDFLEQPYPRGVNNMQLVATDIVRVSFDPKIVGARSLINEHIKHTCWLAPLSGDPGLAAGNKHVRDMGFMTLISIVLTIPVLILAWAPLEARPITYGSISLALATLVQFIVAGPFYGKAFKSLIFSRVMETDLLIVLSTSTAYIFSVVSFGYLVSGNPLSTGEFFQTSTLLVTLIMIGRWTAALSRQKAIESISIQSLQSLEAQLVTSDGTDIECIDTRLFEYGDIFSVLPEHRVPTDGVVLSGFSEIDESMVTGESVPIPKHSGSKVIAGSINGSGKIIVQLTHLPGENTISVIAGMVDNAKLTKPEIQDLADRVASYFVPLILLLTVITFVVWIAVGVCVQNQSGSDAATQAVTYAITVLIVSCPCAIGLAVPMVIVIASGVSAEKGIIFKSAGSLESACKATDIVFDKTGTLTTGKLELVEEDFYNGDIDAQRSLVLGLVANSKHPVSAAIAANLLKRNVTHSIISEIRTLPGKGIEGKADGKVIRGGSARWLQVENDPCVQAILNHGNTLFCVTLDSELLAVFGLTDTTRAEAAATITTLKRLGMLVSLLSGDEAGAVQHVATEVGIDHTKVRSRCSPGDKQEYVQKLLVSPNGKKKRTVVFVGDGTNDSVALAQATIGVHVNSGTDVAQNAADVVLMRPSLEAIPTMIDISRAARLRIKFNFAWSFVYNTLALLLASGALVSSTNGGSIRISPEYAGLGELVSVLPVILIAVGLKWVKF